MRRIQFAATRRRYETAVHEAGHAVVALYYGFKLRPGRCMVLESSESRTRDGATFHSSGKYDDVHDAVVSMAGFEADALYRGKHPGELSAEEFGRLSDECRADRRNAARVLVGREPSFKRNRKVWNLWTDVEIALARQARHILKPRWRTVLALARELAEKGSLDRDDVLRIARRNHGAQVP